MIVGNGYPFESHTVQTEDNYLLTMYRIPYGVSGPSANSKQHGLLSSSADWLIVGKNIAYNLADAGFDVWLGNASENTTNSHAGFYDLPAMIDYIRATTNQTKIHYVGHSQGTTAFLAMASLRPDYTAKIRSTHLFSPVGYMSNLFNPFVRDVAPLTNQMEGAMDLLSVINSPEYSLGTKYSNNDWLSHPNDVHQLVLQLSTPVKLYFAHTWVPTSTLIYVLKTKNLYGTG